MIRIALATIAIFCLATRGRSEETEPGVIESFYQELDVQRAPNFAVQGTNISQQIRYQVLSSFEVYPADAKGNYKATQTVSNATLIEADPVSRAVFVHSLATLRGRTFTYQLDRNHEIVLMEEHRDNTEVVQVEKPKSISTLVSTVIDEDGWKELAALTLFRPPADRRPNQSFVRKMTHDWGSLGSWYGKTTFARKAAQRDLSHYQYQHQLEYIKPEGPGDLPFEILRAQFQAYQAMGVIQFDVKSERVRQVREVFHARGRIETQMLGIPATVDIDERQQFTINVTGQRIFSSESSGK